MTIDVEMLHKLLICDAEAGTLTWRERTPDMFEHAKFPNQACASWNGRYAGKLASIANSDGYKIGKIFNKAYKAHRVIWAIHHGEWPAHEIDHINGNKSDNRIGNLRDVTSAENARNQSMRSINTSGCMGVSFHATRNKWEAHIGVDGKKEYLGIFIEKSDAIAARAAAEIKYKYHKHHGRDEHAD